MAPEPSATALAWQRYRTLAARSSSTRATPAPRGQAQLDPNFSSNAGALPLVHAIRCNQLAIARTLIEHGADVAHADGDNETPLLAAIYQSNVESVELLLEHGARFHERRFIRRDFGSSPIQKFTT